MKITELQEFDSYVYHSPHVWKNYICIITKEGNNVDRIENLISIERAEEILQNLTETIQKFKAQNIKIVNTTKPSLTPNIEFKIEEG
jgi:aspartate/tyrosine/aromatic aminotransferase